MSYLSWFTSLLPQWKVPLPYVPTSGIKLYVYLDSELGIACNRREPDVIRYTREMIESGEHDLVFDVGANIGSYTFLALSLPGVSVHAFEPHSNNVARLDENASLNGLADRLSIVEAAAWSENGMVTLMEGENPQTHAVSPTVESNNASQTEAITLDGYCESHDVLPSLVKVDVEGAAHHVLEGAADILERGQTEWILEYHDEEEREGILERLPSGYESTWVSEEHIHISPRTR